MIHPITGILLALAISFISIANGHTWIEQVSLIGSNGSYTGAYGYPRGYSARGTPQFVSQSYLVPQLSTNRVRVNDSDLLCSPQQRSASQSDGYPRLTVAPGSAIAMRYLENGHVTLPQNQPGKPPKGGTAFVFGTTDPYADELITDVLKWTRDGTGGDRRGYLLAANNYDDGRCHQINSGTISMQRQQEFPNPIPGQPGTNMELWCETDVVLPTDASIIPVGKLLTVYWVWQWPTQPGEVSLPDGKDEYYTTCLDFEVSAEEQDGPITNSLIQQDPNMIALSGYLSRTAITPTPNIWLATATSWPSSSWLTSVPYMTSSSEMLSTTSDMGFTSSGLATSSQGFDTSFATSLSGAEPTTTSTHRSTIHVKITSTIPQTALTIAVSSPTPSPTIAIVASITTPSLIPSSNPLGAIIGAGGGSSNIVQETDIASTTGSISIDTTSYATSTAATTTGNIVQETSNPASSSSIGIDITSLPTSTVTSNPPVGGPITLTAVVTITATLPPGQKYLVVEGSHVVTFTSPTASSTTGPSPP